MSQEASASLGWELRAAAGGERLPGTAGGASAPLSCGFRRRQPETTLLHKVVRDNLETFLADVRATDPNHAGLPRFVEQEFRRYLDCGILSRGFSLFECPSCGKTQVVAFSCKGHGFCPSCLTRRMYSTAMDLTERVLR